MSDLQTTTQDTESATWFVAQCEEASLIHRATYRLRDYCDFDPRSHLDSYGNATGCEEQDPADREELFDLAIALERAIDSFLKLHGYNLFRPTRITGLVFDMGLEAYLAGHEAGRIERAALLVLQLTPGIDEKLDKYGTTDARCSCPDKRRGRDRLCKHQLAMAMMARLRLPWGWPVQTFGRTPAIGAETIPF